MSEHLCPNDGSSIIMNSPLVSVVMSVYNGERYLPRAVESILNQERIEFEFLIIDDGSTDASPAILAEYAARDARVRVITQENQGLTRALIHGCSEARGEFIARQDADDVSATDRLAKQAEWLKQFDTQAVFVSCWAQAIGPEDEILCESRPPAESATATAGMLERLQGPCAHGSVMMRKDAYVAVGGYRWQFYYGQDSDLWIRLAEYGGLGFVPEVLYRYRMRPENISLGSRTLQSEYGRIGRECQRARQVGGDETPLLAEAATLRPARNGNPKARQAAAAGNYFIGSCLKARGDRRANKYLWRAIRNNPLMVRAWLRLLIRPG